MPGFGHHAGQCRGFEAVLGHHPLGGVQHQFANFMPRRLGVTSVRIVMASAYAQFCS